VSIDFLILGILLFAGILGAIAGAARQVANFAALFVAYGCARPLGTVLGPRIAPSIHQSKGVAIVAATLFCFLVVMIAVRYVVTRVLRKLLSTGKEDDERGVDRALGFVLGAAKAGLIAWAVVSGLVFVQQHVSIAGRKLGLVPKSSIAFGVCHRFNLFELTQFGSVNDLVEVAQTLQQPGGAERLRKNRAYRALLKDPRFQQVFADKSLRHALASGDSLTLIHSNAVLNLILDPTARQNLAASLEGK
jgi:membrane protein required for colicin V production